jgi:serine/threonine-protein kinase
VPVGAPADVWGIGVTLYEAAAGRRPFRRGRADAEAPPERWPQLAAAPAPPGDAVPRPLAEPIMACLVRDPAARPEPAALLARFEQVLDALPKPWLAKLKPRPGRR